MTLTISWTQIQQAYVAEAELPGFRKGKAPRELVEAKLNKTRILSQALGHLLPKVYAAAVKEHSLKPILHPQIKIVSGKEGEDWVFTAITCEAPTVHQIPDLLVELQTDHRLATLAENLSGLGITVDKYLAAKKLTPESLRAKLATEVKQGIIQSQHGRRLKP